MMIMSRPHQAERSTHALHFCFLVREEEATGPSHLWPGQGAAVEADIARWVEETKAALAEGRCWAYPQKVVHGSPPAATVERSWVWCDALGRDVRVEPIDAAPIPWRDAHQWLWPETPASVVLPEMRRAA